MPRLRDALGPRIWRALRTIAVEYIALVFARDFILGPLQDIARTYPATYLPFALMLVGGASLRFAAFASRLRHSPGGVPHNPDAAADHPADFMRQGDRPPPYTT